MFMKETENGGRGQVGIGTLIVFIAMVLVAAIAAGVLINTAGLLQSQAEATGEESTAQVANQVVVQTATGSIDDGSIDTISMTVSLAPGSNPVDLGNANYQYIGSSVVNLEEGDDDIDFFELSELSEADPSSAEGDGLVLESGDQLVVELDIDGTGNELDEEQLEGGDSAEFIITTADGAQAVEILSVPSPLGDESAVSL